MIDEIELYNEELRPFESLEGKFLVASRSLDGSCFEKAIIYICAHDEKGAIGIIINNKIGSFYLKDYVKNMQIKSSLKNKKIPVMFGGPVDQDKLIILTVSKKQEKNFDKIQSVTIYTESENFLYDCACGKTHDKFIAAKGIAAWDPYQLERELSQNSWLVAPANIDILFSQRLKNKWEKVVASIGVKNFSYLVNYSGTA
jgi:putative transcriptional regulator